ncbi:ABC transporter permease subunit [Streptomyces sp. NPDC050610]|uniref:ABC transporter permease subunit n=1 Tax=Streptomyces sp. NPDC050610 TaxID=3157097 RepID=UPI00342091FA
MSTTAPARTGTTPAKRRPRVLHGLVWLVWRQHRIAFWLLIAAGVIGSAVMIYQRTGLVDLLHHSGKGDGNQSFHSLYDSLFQDASESLQSLPALIGVFLGAPLIASDRESGTAQLVTTQATGRDRWIATKLGMAAAITLVCTAALAAAFTWLWKPARLLVSSGDWLGSDVFDVTGPMPVAFSLLMLVTGVAIGMLLRRAIAAMALTLVVGFAVQIVWDYVRPMLASPRVLTFPFDSDGIDKLPSGAVQIDNWISTADNKLYGFGTCVGDAHPDACRAKLGIVNNYVEYFGYDQMQGMQWLGAGILLALAAAITVFILWWVRRRPM